MRVHFIACLGIVYTSFAFAQTTWMGTGNGNWSDPNEWTVNVPDGIDQVVNFDTTAASTNVKIDYPATVGQMNITSGNTSYLFTGTYPLTFFGISTPAEINSNGSQNIILDSLNLDSDTIFSAAAGNQLSISSHIDAHGINLSTTGAGAIDLSYVRSNSLNVQQGTTRIFNNGSASAISEVNSLSVSPGAKLDLENNSAIVNYSGTNPLSTLTHDIATAYDQGKWDGAGITSSTAPSTPGAALGIGDASTLGLSSYEGFSVLNSVILKYTWYGDANLDGKVDNSDLAIIQNGMAKHLTGWENGDFNYDGVINADDLALYDLGLARQTTVLNGGVVPEPAALGIAGAALIFCTRRRLRKSTISASW